MNAWSKPAANVPAQTPRTQKVGRVVSDKMDKTVVVAVDYVRRHPLVSQAHHPDEQILGARRAERLQTGRHRSYRGDAAALKHKRLDRSRNSSSEALQI